jgi:hypothetical protein
VVSALQVEACDALGGFLLLQSMAGGTGAGLGTYVAHALRDEYPSSHALNCCVWPYESGEVIVQVGHVRTDSSACLVVMLFSAMYVHFFEVQTSNNTVTVCNAECSCLLMVLVVMILVVMVVVVVVVVLLMIHHAF